MNEMMDFPKTPLEFVECYKFKDSDKVYTNGSELIQVLRVKQMLEHYYKPLSEKATPKKPKKERVYDEVWDCTLTVATCSNCACEVCNGTNYCENCGYALDWSEE